MATSISNNTAPPVPLRTIVILAFDDVTASDVSGVADVFAIATRFIRPAGNSGYHVVVASVDGTPIRTSSGLTFTTTALSSLDIDAIDTLVVPGGGPPQDPPVPIKVVDWLSREGHRPKRLCGICTGTFLLAEARLVGNRRVTTHWQSTDVLMKRYPEVSIEPDRVYLQDRGLWTSAGFTAGFDLALAILEEDQGYAAAMETAKSIVVFVKRAGEEAQLSAALTTQSVADRQFSRLHAWIIEHLSENLTIEVLAEQVGMAPRTFTRRYAEQMGSTPAKTIHSLRMEAVMRAVADRGFSLKQIARNCGFGDVQNLRRHFVRHCGISPEQYRRNFAVGELGSSAKESFAML
ncbi:GlxA family transcriptional regulator [Duganella sp. Dugasp56]|uniref:GlxA family transcriptional regulator n=1 Tax=Duganella sp. Dugasp56 TaxID=3243046 RepID=UPI0039B10C13